MAPNLTELSTQHTSNGLSMVITVRTNAPLRYEQVIELQKTIVDRLRQPVSLKVNQIFAERLDPLIPPTFTPTPTPTLTNTPGPSPTATIIPTLTPSLTPTSTLTPTPGIVKVVNAALPQPRMYQSPGGPVIGSIRTGQQLTLLYGQQEFNGILWVQVMDEENRIGWIPSAYLVQITQTPSSTPSITPTPTKNP